MIEYNPYKLLTEYQMSVIEKYVQSAPVKLGALARELGISVKVDVLKRDVSGWSFKKDDQYFIYIDRYTARASQRATLARHIAHFLLHRDEIDFNRDGIRSFYSDSFSAYIIQQDTKHFSKASEMSFQANKLADDLLIPIPLLHQKIKDGYESFVTRVTVEKLAGIFEVSKYQIEKRMKK